MGRTISGLLIILGSSSILPGCTSTAYIAEYATEYNKAVEKTNNEELLLNILRASKRRPTYFTYVTTVRGGPGLSLGSGQLSIPFGEGSTTLAAKTLSGTLGYTGTSGFDIGVVDTQEFMRGYTTPVDMKTFGYYWSQSWPQELLWMLFVKKIEVDVADEPPQGLKEPENELLDWATAGNRACDADMKPRCQEIRQWRIEKVNGKDAEKDFVTKVYTFDNYPEDAKETARFLSLSRKLIGQHFRLAPVQAKGDLVGISLDEGKAARIEEAMIRAKNDEYSIKPDPKKKTDHYKLQDKGSIALSYPGGCTPSPESTGEAPKSPGEHKAQTTSRPRAESSQSSGTTEPGSCSNAPQLSIYLRSPEAMLYFLGEMVRVELRHGNAAKIAMCRIREGDPDVHMIDIQKLDDLQGAFPLSVDFDGHRYGMLSQTEVAEIDESDEAKSLRQCREETTTQTLSLLSQVIALQKSAKDLPAIGVVHVSP